MKNKKSIVIGSIVAVLVLVGVVVTQTSLIQGFIVKRQPRPVDMQNPPKYFLDKGKIVTMVTSPVTSVVVSKVTSPAATSNVASAVTSGVASKVAGGKRLTDKEKTTKFPTITAEDLIKEAKADMKRNPAKYILSDAEKNKIIEMWLKTHKL